MSAKKTTGVADLGHLTDKQIAIYTAESARRTKSVGVAYGLLIFLWPLGVHQFYISKPVRGLLFLAGAGLGYLFLIAGLGAGLSAEDEATTNAAVSTFLLGWFALGVVGLMWLWDLFTLPRQVRQRDDRMRAELVEELRVQAAA